MAEAEQTRAEIERFVFVINEADISHDIAILQSKTSEQESDLVDLKNQLAILEAKKKAVRQESAKIQAQVDALPKRPW